VLKLLGAACFKRNTRELEKRKNEERMSNSLAWFVENLKREKE
jgi:hypothetical protein